MGDLASGVRSGIDESFHLMQGKGLDCGERLFVPARLTVRLVL